MVEKFCRKPNTNCGVCKIAIYRRPSAIASGKVYCSKKCYGIGNRKYHPCPICLKETAPTKNTCSRVCSNKLRVGIKYNYTNNKNKATKARSIKIKLFKERGTKCEKCNYNNENVLQIHHIIERKDGGTDNEDNLIILCPNCHCTSHLGDSRLGNEPAGSGACLENK